MKKEVTLKNVKGSYDYSPQEQRIRYFIQDTLRNVFEGYGYKPLETPILCYYDILAGKYDESNDLLNEIYKLTDQGDRLLGLRYDLTVPFAKYIATQKELRLPFKRYEIGKVFRDGPVKVGRDREFLQCDVDVVGLSGALVEAELISLWFMGYKSLGIRVFVKYNNRDLMRGLIKEVTGIKDEDAITHIVTVIDKMDKISENELVDELGKCLVNEEKARELLNCFAYSLEQITGFYSDSTNETLTKGLKEVSELARILADTGFGEETVFTPSLARGQDYYTGNVFEVYALNGELTCSLGGGGRYDKMITDFVNDGNIYPAVGVSFGLSTIYEILKTREVKERKSLTDIFIIPMGTESESLILANRLRYMGYIIEIEMMNRKVKKSFDFANKEDIPYVVVLGEDELKNGVFKIKKMETGEEFEVHFDNLDELEDIIV